MDIAFVIYIIIMFIIIGGHFASKYAKINRLTIKMSELMDSSSTHEILITNNIPNISQKTCKTFNEIYPFYLAYIQKRYAYAGVPGTRGDEGLYKIAKLKDSNAFFIVTFYNYLSPFFSIPCGRLNKQEILILNNNSEQLREIYDCVHALATKMLK